MKRVIILILGAICVSTSVMATDYESSAFGVNDFTSAGTCGGTDLSYGIDSANGWKDGMDNISYDQNAISTNLGVDGRDFTDYGNYTWGRDYLDPTGADFAEAAFIYTHGGTGTSGVDYSYPVMGDDVTGETCRPRTSLHMEFGSNSSSSEELNVFVNYSCSSLHYNIYDNGGYQSLNDGASSGSYAKSFKMYAGYHGTGHGYSTTDDKLEDYVTDAIYNGIGDDWVDSFTIIRPRVGEDDDCATALVFGEVTELKNYRDSFFNYAGFKDFDGVGDYDGTSYYGIEDCDPGSGDPLP